MSDVAAPRWRSRVAVALLLVGVVVAFVPALVADDEFVGAVHVWDSSGRGRWIDLVGRGYVTHPGPYTFVYGTSAISLVGSDAAWAAVAVSLALVPVLFAWWRRADLGFARAAGLACAVVASAAVVVLVASIRRLSDPPEGAWWTVPVGSALMAAAFVVAPTPRVRDE